jgi:hypothetical protein
MQVTIDIEPGTFSLLEKIKDKGLSLDEVLHDALDKFETGEHPQRRMTADEWIKSLKAWASRSKGGPSPSDESIRRDNIYDDRS